MSDNITTTTPSVVIYVRVASDDAGAADAQEARLRRSADSHGWRLVTVIPTVGASGLSPELRETLCAGDILLVHGTDRLSRDWVHVLEFWDALRAADVRLMVDSEGGVCEEVLSSPFARLLTTLPVSQREHERQIHSTDPTRDRGGKGAAGGEAMSPCRRLASGGQPQFVSTPGSASCWGAARPFGMPSAIAARVIYERGVERSRGSDA